MKILKKHDWTSRSVLGAPSALPSSHLQMILVAKVPLTLGGREIPLGAYTVLMIPDKKNWTLIVSKNVTSGAQYNSAEDVARAPMEIGEIPEATKQLQLAFAHMSAKQCSLRVYYQKTGAFVDFLEQ